MSPLSTPSCNCLLFGLYLIWHHPSRRFNVVYIMVMRRSGFGWRRRTVCSRRAVVVFRHDGIKELMFCLQLFSILLPCHLPLSLLIWSRLCHFSNLTLKFPLLVLLLQFSSLFLLLLSDGLVLFGLPRVFRAISGILEARRWLFRFWKAKTLGH